MHVISVVSGLEFPDSYEIDLFWMGRFISYVYDKTFLKPHSASLSLSCCLNARIKITKAHQSALCFKPSPFFSISVVILVMIPFLSCPVIPLGAEMT